MWIRLVDGIPPVGDCKHNLLLLWIKCPEQIPYPEYYMGYEMGFFDGDVFIDNEYRYRIDNVEYWSLLHERPNRENIENF
jgi:hypothetical protein